MKKKVLSLLLTGAMIAAMLTGCGNADANTDSSSGETDQTESTEAAETGKEIDISFYTTETGKDDMFQQLISDFDPYLQNGHNFNRRSKLYDNEKCHGRTII